MNIWLSKPGGDVWRLPDHFAAKLDDGAYISAEPPTYLRHYARGWMPPYVTRLADGRWFFVGRGPNGRWRFVSHDRAMRLVGIALRTTRSERDINYDHAARYRAWRARKAASVTLAAAINA